MNNSDNKSHITIMRFLNGKQVELNGLGREQVGI